MKCHFRAAWPETIIHKTYNQLSNSASRIIYKLGVYYKSQLWHSHVAMSRALKANFCILCICIKNNREIKSNIPSVQNCHFKLADRILTNGGLIVNQKFKHQKPTLWHISDANCIFKTGTFKSTLLVLKQTKGYH